MSLHWYILLLGGAVRAGCVLDHWELLELPGLKHRVLLMSWMWVILDLKPGSFRSER